MQEGWEFRNWGLGHVPSIVDVTAMVVSCVEGTTLMEGVGRCRSPGVPLAYACLQRLVFLTTSLKIVPYSLTSNFSIP